MLNIPKYMQGQKGKSDIISLLVKFLCELWSTKIRYDRYICQISDYRQSLNLFQFNLI